MSIHIEKDQFRYGAVRFVQTRRTTTRYILMAVTMAMLGLPGCKSYDVIPDELESELATDLTYEMVRDAPGTHQGKLIAWGGVVVDGKRLQGGTRLVVLQLPLTNDLHPTEERNRSKGRFLAFDNEGTITDPDAIEPGTPVTIIGRVGPEQHEKLEGVDYRYPRVDVLDMTVWERKVGRGWLRYGPFRNLIYDPWSWKNYKRHRID